MSTAEAVVWCMAMICVTIVVVVALAVFSGSKETKR